MEIVEVADGLAFPGRPVMLPGGEMLVVEIAKGCITRIGKGGKKTVLATPGGGPNGAAFGPDGHLYVCNNGGFAWATIDGGLRPTGQPQDYSGGRIERVNIETGKVDVLYTECNGFKLRGPTTSSSIHRAGSISTMASAGRATWIWAASTMRRRTAAISANSCSR